MRLFLGIELPIEIKNHIALSVAPLQKSPKGWEDPRDYHMTLLFIGETSEDLIPSIEARLKQISFTPFILTFRAVAFFPRRVLYLSCDPSQELSDLKTTLDQMYSEYVRVGEKKFIPHITLKRWQRYEYDELRKKILENPFEEKSIKVDHLALFKSEKDPAFQKYHVLLRN